MLKACQSVVEAMSECWGYPFVYIWMSDFALKNTCQNEKKKKMKAMKTDSEHHKDHSEGW